MITWVFVSHVTGSPAEPTFIDTRWRAAPSWPPFVTVTGSVNVRAVFLKGNRKFHTRRLLYKKRIKHSKAFSMTNKYIQENKLHLIKGRFKQICLKTFFFKHQ